MANSIRMPKLLALNRGEIAIRIMRAATELGLRTVAVYSKEDRLSLHRFKADEAWQIGEGLGPVQAYLDVEGIVALAKEKDVDLIHPGYGFLSENSALPRACERAGITFVGPSAELLDLLGDKTSARGLAERAGVPIVPGTENAIEDPDEARAAAERIGFPLIIKAAFGGGGRGMRVVERPQDFAGKLEEARREAAAAFGNGAVFLERYIRRARHVEIQILGDRHGNILHLYERDCSVQRRHQKVVEVAPAVNLPESLRKGLADAAIRLARAAHYYNAGTVEFLVDVERNEFYFIEVNPRIQVEHTVTEMVTGIDLVRCQILVAQGYRLSEAPMSLPAQEQVPLYGYALQCRVTTEDPEHNFTPDYGQHTDLSLARRIRRAPRRGLGVQRGFHHPVLRLAPRQSQHMGPRFRPGLQPHGPLAARVPRTRRKDEYSLPRKRRQSSRLSRRQHHDVVPRSDTGPVHFRAEKRSGDEDAHVSGRDDRQRERGGGSQDEREEISRRAGARAYSFAGAVRNAAVAG